jgi:AcrR family transcriptional regulator
MARWEGNTRGRLERAVLDLFTEQGYDRTTVAQIARRANLTERSCYRWFTDKREVLFAGDDLSECFLSAIDAVPAGTGALPTLLSALATAPEGDASPRVPAGARSGHHGQPAAAGARADQDGVAVGAVTTALMRRGFDRQTAGLATDVGMAVLRLASQRWVADTSADFAELLSASAADLLAVAAEGAPRSEC